MTDNLNSTFSLKLANQVLQEEIQNGTNSAVSPLSFRVILALIATGSTGRTLEQLQFHLGFISVHELKLLSSNLAQLVSNRKNVHDLAEGPLVSFVNGVWVDQSVGFNFAFRSLAQQLFNAEVKEVDFVNKVNEVRDEVNSWVESITNGLIKEILPSGSLEQDISLVLANALYFKGAWYKLFDRTRTELRNFNCLDGEKVQVPFMTSSEKQFYKDCKDYTILQIPYQKGEDTQQFSMYFFLPAKIDGLQSMLHQFTSNPGFFNQEFELEEEKLSELWIPRFKFSYEFEASGCIKKLGLDLPFMETGELNGMVNFPGGNNLFVSKVFHKVFIEVNEEGTEAAASTATASAFGSASFPTASFVADHPFLFMIRELNSKDVLFIGTVVNPT